MWDHGHDDDGQQEIGAADRLLEMAPGVERDELLSQLPGETRRQTEQLIAAGDLAWESQFLAPPLEQDPIAAMLGLLPDSEYRLDGAAVAKLRKAHSLTVGDLADQLATRGWQTRSRDVFAWETGSATLAPAMVRAIAAVLNTTPDRLTPGTPAVRDGVGVTSASTTVSLDAHERAAATARSSTKFQTLVARYADLMKVTTREAIGALSTKMLSTAHRGNHPDPEQILDALEALMGAMESRPLGSDNVLNTWRNEQ